MPHLLGLPAEVQCRIFAYALHEPAPITVEVGKFKEPGLLFVNRQIKHEATPIFYEVNVFCWSVLTRNTSILDAWVPATAHNKTKMLNIALGPSNQHKNYIMEHDLVPVSIVDPKKPRVGRKRRASDDHSHAHVVWMNQAVIDARVQEGYFPVEPIRLGLITQTFMKRALEEKAEAEAAANKKQKLA